MAVANVAVRSDFGLPPSLSTAQAAIHLPEVQAMLRRLAEYKLAIFMPHMQGEQTGGFQPLPPDLMQVESGLKVSFRPTEEIACQPQRFLPVGWFWHAGAAAPVTACEMVTEAGWGGTGPFVKHKRPDEDSKRMK